jgi:hypothetical protein
MTDGTSRPSASGADTGILNPPDGGVGRASGRKATMAVEVTVSGRVYRLRDEALMSVEAGDELVALDMRTSMYFGANASGRLLWRRLSTDASAAELAGLLSATYGLDAGTATRDVEVFLEELRDAGLLVSGG